MSASTLLLLIDDAFAVLIVTLIGISFHQPEGAIAWARVPYTFLPFLLVWVLAAALLELYKPAIAADWRQLWRVPLGVAAAALPATALRSLWLGTPVTYTFAAVMGAVLALGLLISRSLMTFIIRQLQSKRG